VAMRSRACISAAYLLQGPACPRRPYSFPDPDQNVIKIVTTQHIRRMIIFQHWIPAFAGMTSRTMPFSRQS
jgi:hypothetical protein